jgi:cytochrome c
MKMSHQVSLQGRSHFVTGIVAGAFVLFISASAFAEVDPAAAAPAEAAAVKVDADAAVKLARTDHCLRCHSVNKKKEGPTYHAIAYKYQGKPEAFDKLVKHITSGEDRVKLTDGHEETHKFDKSTDIDQIKNLIRWILAQ